MSLLGNGISDAWVVKLAISFYLHVLTLIPVKLASLNIVGKNGDVLCPRKYLSDVVRLKLEESTGTQAHCTNEACLKPIKSCLNAM